MDGPGAGATVRPMTRRTHATVTSTLLGALAAYALVVRPRMLRWGATPEEVDGPYPGADVIPGGARSATMAVTLDAPPAAVWPWLVQMGAGRAGWYSWDRLDDFGARSAEHLHPEWQDVSLGDRLPARPDASQWWEVAALEPERFLGLRMSLDLRGRPFDPRGAAPSTATDSLWGFRLVPLPRDRTRLVVSGYWAMRPGWLRLPMSVLFLEPSHWVMQTRQFANLRRRVERPSPSPASR